MLPEQLHWIYVKFHLISALVSKISAPKKKCTFHCTYQWWHIFITDLRHMWWWWLLLLRPHSQTVGIQSPVDHLSLLLVDIQHCSGILHQWSLSYKWNKKYPLMKWFLITWRLHCMWWLWLLLVRLQTVGIQSLLGFVCLSPGASNTLPEFFINTEVQQNKKYPLMKNNSLQWIILCIQYDICFYFHNHSYRQFLAYQLYSKIQTIITDNIFYIKYYNYICIVIFP